MADAYGTLLATLVADVGGKLIESFPVWVIQEHQLTWTSPEKGRLPPKARLRRPARGCQNSLTNLVSGTDCQQYRIPVLIADNLGGDVALFAQTCGETNYLAEVRAALLIVQRVRYELDDSKTPVRPREVLPTTAKAVDEAISECELEEPGVQTTFDSHWRATGCSQRRTSFSTRRARMPREHWVAWSRRPMDS